MVGKSIAHFEITAKIGEGGMGEVYQATDKKLNRQVALKILPQSFAQDPQRMGRFSREAQVLASLNHPSIAAIYGLEEANGTKALVMELVEGEDLSERIARGPIPLDEALPVALQIAEALEDAHEKGVIHRDLKPANIKLTPEGKVKILDFGLAKALEGERTQEQISDSPTLTMQATQAGIILGTAAYMSPEQARGKQVDRRADIWAFGTVLFEVLTAKRAFQGEDLSLTLASVMKDDPDWKLLPGTLPRVVHKLLERCLKKDPRLRLRDIGEARIAIGEYLSAPLEQEALPVKLSIAGTTRMEKLRQAAPILIALAVGALATWALVPHPEPLSPIRIKTNLSGEQPIYTPWGNSLALSPDGTRLAFVQGPSFSRRLHLRSLERLESEELQGTERAVMPFFSPDGRWVGFFSGSYSEGELKKVSVSGGTPLTLCSTGRLACGGTWGPDGTIVFGSPNGTLMKISEAGGAPQELTHLGEGQASHCWPQFLPGGRHVLFVSNTASGAGEIEVVELESGRRKIIHRGGRYPRYVASNHLLYVDSGTLFAVSFDPGQLETTGEAAPVLEGLMADNFDQGAVHYGVASDGTLAYLPGTTVGERTLIWVDERGAVFPASKHRRNYENFPRLSPDGKRVAVVINSENNLDLWILDLERDLLTRLTFDEALDFTPVWSPDGRWIYFRSDQSGKPGIYRMQADGTGGAEQLLEAETGVPVRDISPDGKYLAYCPGSGGNIDIFLLPLAEGGSPQAFLADPHGEGSPRFSPDGHWLAYDSDESGSFEVYIRRFPGAGGKVQVSTEGGFRPHWSADGRRLFYRTDDAIWVSNIDVQGEILRPGKAQRLIDLEGTSNQSFEVGDDGKRFLLIRDSEEQDRTEVVFAFNWFEELKRLVPTE